MKHNQIESLNQIGVENYENIFNVYQDENNMYFYNLMQTIVFPPNLPTNLFETYTVKYGDSWPLISYNTLNNTNLWWIILLANGISNPIFPNGAVSNSSIRPKQLGKAKQTYGPVPGTTIKIPIMAVVKEVLLQMRKQ